MDPTTHGIADSPVPGVFRRTGGLRWHARVLRRWRLHQPFRNEIAQFLDDLRPNGRSLILVGSSGGWFLPTRFLAQFSRLTIIELDRSAPFFFRLRHGAGLRRAGSSAEWIFEDFVSALPPLLIQGPGVPVLFCNVLGQLGLERADYEKRLAALPGMLEGHPWASFHDRFSTVIDGATDGVNDGRGFPDQQGFSSESPLDSVRLQHMGYAGVWIDHGTGGLLPARLSRRYLPWRITPKRFHWVEAGTVSGGGLSEKPS